MHPGGYNVDIVLGTVRVYCILLLHTSQYIIVVAGGRIFFLSMFIFWIFFPFPSNLIPFPLTTHTITTVTVVLFVRRV